MQNNATDVNADARFFEKMDAQSDDESDAKAHAIIVSPSNETPATFKLTQDSVHSITAEMEATVRNHFGTIDGDFRFGVNKYNGTPIGDIDFDAQAVNCKFSNTHNTIVAEVSYFRDDGTAYPPEENMWYDIKDKHFCCGASLITLMGKRMTDAEQRAKELSERNEALRQQIQALQIRRRECPRHRNHNCRCKY